MATQLLIYETAVPLSFQRHGDYFLETGTSYGFGRNINSVPLMAVEFPPAASEYAIVFGGENESILPAVILGMRNNENLFVSERSAWGAKYIPAFVRRYPFVFSEAPEGDKFVLCIDEDFSGFNSEGRGERLFEDGKPTAFVRRVLDFLQEYQAQFQRTQQFCKKLWELDLLEPMQANLDLASGERLSLSGFLAVNRARLKALPADKLAELVKTDELELLYLHLQSMRNFTELRERLVAIQGGKADSEAEDQVATADDETPVAAEQDESDRDKQSAVG
jgi:hypothetical protein